MKPALLKLFLKPSSVSDGGFACRGSKKWKPHYLYRSIGHVTKWGPEKRIIDHFFFHNNYGQLSICFKRNFTMIETNWCSYVYLLSMFPHREQTAPHREQTAPFLLKKICLWDIAWSPWFIWSWIDGQTPPSRTGEGYIDRQSSEFWPDNPNRVLPL